MLVAPSSVTHSNPRLPSADHRLKIPSRPSIATRRHSTTVGSLSPSHLSRPLRSSPLAGPAIAASNDGTLVSPVSAPPTPGGGTRHLSPLAEFSTTASETQSVIEGEVTTKKQRRRTLGAVFSKLNFPAAQEEGAAQAPQPVSPATPPRRRTKSTTSQDAPPVPPVPSWAQSSTPTRTHPKRHSQIQPSPSSTRAHGSPPDSRSKTSRSTSPTPSAHSGTGSVKSATSVRPMSLRPPANVSTSPENNWLTQAAPPRFSRLGLKAEGVVLPVSAREIRRRSTASVTSSRARSFDALPPPPMPARTPSRASTASMASMGSIGSLSRSAPPTLSGARPSTAPANQQRFFRSRASSRASLASAASGLSSADYCDTPSLTMSPGPSASDVSVAYSADEMGVLCTPPGGRVEFQINDVPVGVLALPAQAYKGKGKERAIEYEVAVHEAEVGPGVGPWMRVSGSGSTTPSGLSSAATSVVDLSAGGPNGRYTRPAAATAGKEGAKAKRTHTLGRMWKQVVRSVTSRR
ncbi:hypothetical protein PYCCODRAFT_1437190 [Trametes coccinea BRFM310]|uniref:Uncharacterized protein n=1 Tax=Trametes coccinea (strain BRFM310) TaxID=1353009 RepID=A0A1Y2IL00_TRAC3|nr:hypothetical protein PYCCODRAFT_1437190 [Trametes coccinea BRFM310]